MKNKKLLTIVLLILSFCFVSGAGYGEINKQMLDVKASFLDVELQRARIDYMMTNLDNFLHVSFYYDFAGVLAYDFPGYVSTKGKVFISIIDNRDFFSDKSGIVRLNLFKRLLKSLYSFIEVEATDMDTDIVAKLYSKEGIPLAYFYQGEYHLWEANAGEKIEGDKVTSSEPFLFENIEIWKISRVRSGAILGTEITGEIVNQSGVNYVSHAWFRVTLYGSQGEVLGGREFTTFDLKDGQRKKFEAEFYNVESNRVSDYKIEFDRGS